MAGGFRILSSNYGLVAEKRSFIYTQTGFFRREQIFLGEHATQVSSEVLLHSSKYSAQHTRLLRLETERAFLSGSQVNNVVISIDPSEALPVLLPKVKIDVWSSTCFIEGLARIVASVAWKRQFGLPQQCHILPVYSSNSGTVRQSHL